jgi:hypothetical protein
MQRFQPVRRSRLALALSALMLVSLQSATGVSAGLAEPGCGRVLGSALTIGFGPSGFGYLAANIESYAFSHSNSAPSQYALFQTHDPWGDTVVKTAITDAGHSYSGYGPSDLDGFDFSDFRVVVLNWDDSYVSDFSPYYEDALPYLERYVADGGIVWLQAAIQGGDGDTVAAPFGALETWNLSASDDVVATSNSMVAGAPDPITGNSASHANFTNLPDGSLTVVRQGDSSGPASLYDQAACDTRQPDGRIKKGAGALVGNDIYNSDATDQMALGFAQRGDTVKFTINIQNDGTTPDRFKVGATGNATVGHRVRYFRGTTDITAAVNAGTYVTPMRDPGATFAITVKVKVQSTAADGSASSRLVSIKAKGAAWAADSVEFGVHTPD